MALETTSKFENTVRDALTATIHWTSKSMNKESAFHPPMDVRVTSREHEVFIDLPGVDEDDIQFCWTDQELSISGLRDFNHDVDDAEEFTQLQRKFGPFQCSIPLDGRFDVTRTTAKYKRGVLKIRIPLLDPSDKANLL